MQARDRVGVASVNDECCRHDGGESTVADTLLTECRNVLSMTAEIVTDWRCELGEGPIWHTDQQRLYWVDITAGRLLQYDPSTDESKCVHEEDVISSVTIQRDGSLLLFMDQGRVGQWRDGEMERVVEIIDSKTRFNDTIADPAGRVFCGTMPDEDSGGSLYLLDRDGTATQIESAVAIPNGMGFTPTRQHCYFTETNAETIYRYEYDEATGELTDRRPFVGTDEELGSPDGMTVDSEGCVWSAQWHDGCVVRYDPDGEELARYDLPAEKTTSVAFGGVGLDELYVTSAGADDPPAAGTEAGALFQIKPGVSGVPEFRSEITLE